MGLHSELRALGGAVKRLEEAAGRGRGCVFCRVHLPTPLPDPTKPRSVAQFKVKCEFCHTERTFPLTGRTEQEREVTRLLCTITQEDQFTDPRAHAFILWCQYWRKAESRPGKEWGAGLGVVKDDALARKGEKLGQEVRRLIEKKRERLAAKYGADPFPEHERLIESVREIAEGKRPTKALVHGLPDLEEREAAYMVCAELERIVWGRPWPETSSAIERIGLEIDGLIRKEEEREARRAEDRSRQQEEAERLRREGDLRRQEEERVRQEEEAQAAESHRQIAQILAHFGIPAGGFAPENEMPPRHMSDEHQPAAASRRYRPRGDNGGSHRRYVRKP